MADADKIPTPAKRAEIASRTVAIDGNELTLITEGPERLAVLIDLIDGAKHSLRMLYYIYRGDGAGGLVREAIERALDRGVDVALLVDGFGFAAPENYFADLIAKRMRFCRFHPTFGRRYLIRNHQKLALADERRVLIGGFNIEDDYFQSEAQGGWRPISTIFSPGRSSRVPKSARSIALSICAAKRRGRCNGPSVDRLAGCRHGPRRPAAIC